MANLTQLQKDLISTSTYDGIKSDFSANVGQLGTAVIENVVPVSLNTPTINGGTTYLETVGQNSIKQDGDYIKITGNNFTESVNVVFGFSRENISGVPNSTSAYLNSSVLFSNSNTIIASVSSFSTKSATDLGENTGQTQYKIFVFNSDGTYAFKRLPTERIVSNYGYFAGGWLSSSNGVLSNLRRLDFSSETTNADNRGNLVGGSSWSASAQNKTYGYVFFGSKGPMQNNGGPSSVLTPSYNTAVSRINFSNDSTSQENYHNLSGNDYGFFGHTTYSSPTSFYFGHGFQVPAAGSVNSNINKINYDNSTLSTVAKIQNNGIAATADVSISDYGYSLGGSRDKNQAGLQMPSSPIGLVQWNSYSCTTRLNFMNDTNENIIRASSGNRSWSSGTVDFNNSKFYFVGGLVWTKRLTNPTTAWDLQEAPVSYVFQYFNDTFSTATNTTRNIGISLVSNAVDKSYFINSTFTTPGISPYNHTLENLMSGSTTITRLQFSNGTLTSVSNTSDQSWSSVGLTGYI